MLDYMIPAGSKADEVLNAIKNGLKDQGASAVFCGSCSARLVYCDYQFWLHGKEENGACTVPIAFCPYCDGVPSSAHGAAAA